MIPERLATNITNIYGLRGKKWLHNLPNLLREYEKKWGLQVGKCYANAGFNYVAPVILGNDCQAVLKCGPSGPEFSAEVAALKYFKAVGAVQLIRATEEAGVMLLEKINPGILLEDTLNEDQATLYSVGLMNKLHRPIDKNDSLPFVTLESLFEGFKVLYRYFEGGTGPFPSRLIDKAQYISHELLDSMGKSVLLHGDLHYANILCSEQDDCKAIDPKGVIGEREYEIPFPRLNQDIDKNILQHSLDRFIEYSGFDRQRIIGWAFAKSVLAAWWTFEDSGNIEQKFIYSAEIFEQMLSPQSA